MADFSIGISGLNAAQKAMNVIGNNIANAATPGYHRQRIELTPAFSAQIGELILGGGVDIAGITRVIDTLLEKEILRQQSSLSQVSQELGTLRTIENAFGELVVGGSLSVRIDEFFGALNDLCNHPGEIIWQEQVVSAAQAMAGQFRTLGQFLVTLEDQIVLEALNTVDQINALVNQIAELNDNIERKEIMGAQANDLRDQRDQCITELSELIGVETTIRENGVVDVAAAGVPVVIGASALELEVSLQENGKLGITVAGDYNYNENVQGGQLGGLFSLINELIPETHNGLDDLANAIITQINQYHVQGVGSEGSFTKLTGWPMSNDLLADFDPPITNGDIYIRVTDTDTGTISRHKISIPADADSLTTLAAYITSSVPGVKASVQASKLVIEQDSSNYRFDFLPAVLPEPTTSTLTEVAVSVSGIYTGTENDTFKFTVSGAGSVGNGTLQLEVKDNGGAGDVIATFNIGSGYAAGDKLDLGNGIKVSLSSGDVNAGDNFDVDVFADTDTSGLLAAAGINTFFSGSTATDIEVRSDIINSPALIATALGSETTDNTNAMRMAGLKDQALSSLNDMTPGEFYNKLVTNTGQLLSVKQMRHDNMEIILQNLNNQQGEVSGVNINDEAAQMLIYEQMFQAMAKYINTIRSSLLTLMEII